MQWGYVSLKQDATDGREMLVWLSKRGAKAGKIPEKGYKKLSPKGSRHRHKLSPIKYYAAEAPLFLATNNQRRPEKFMTTAAKNVGIQLPGRKLTNDSVRKTCSYFPPV